jgi:hypothetical protein
MIGVIANSSEHGIVREFFELFKTPWEFYRGDRSYEVVVVAGDGDFTGHASHLLVLYGSRQSAHDRQNEASHAVDAVPGGRICLYNESRLPLYADALLFPERQHGFLADAESHQPLAYLEGSGGTSIARIGYDLFREIHFLLTAGQPAANASLPALELHIALLRGLIVAAGAALVEIPPVPDGYRFIASLTHDVDHPSVRRHRLDHTMLGFLYRAVFRSIFQMAKGRISGRQLWANWKAALKLPFVHLGLVRDFWQDFDRYPALEGGARSSFFIIPFPDDAGQGPDGPAPKQRAARYGAKDIATQVRTLEAAGCEVGLHGIDAWRDSGKGREELEQIRRLTGGVSIGVRMHWLYFDRHSPAMLEQAGADYDSTVGYNEAIGYRAGTTQVYKPFDTTRLLELPLHIMDTALFYPNRMDLSPADARRRVRNIVDNAVEFGGTVTLNWHDRSIAPERNWGDFYVDVVRELKNRGAWCATAAETVAWFRKRRAAAFRNDNSQPVEELFLDDAIEGNDLPGLQLTIHNQRPMGAFADKA